MNLPHTIALVHPGRAILPEIDVYARYFHAKGWQMDTYTNLEFSPSKAYSVTWYMMGTALPFRSKSPVTIHEYISTSIPPFRTLKNLFKRYATPMAQGRVFADSSIAHILGYQIDANTRFRPPGVSAAFFTPRIRKEQPTFDFVYTGAMDTIRNIQQPLLQLMKGVPDCRILLVGDPPPQLWNTLRKYPQLTFTGKVAYRDIPELLAQAEYGLNLIPDIAPLNQQPSLKLLEYCAAGMKIITTDVPWARAFAQRRGGTFYFLSPDRPISRNALTYFPFKTPNVQDLCWETIMERAALDFWLEHLLEQQK